MGLCEGCSLCAQKDAGIFFTAWLDVDHVTMSVCALSCSALLSSHNQWPFSLGWWMRDKCSASKHVAPTVLSLSVSLSIFLALLVFLAMLPLLSSLYMLIPWRSATYTAVSLCSVHVYFSWVQGYARVFACAVVWLSLTSTNLCMIRRCHHTSFL